MYQTSCYIIFFTLIYIYCLFVVKPNVIFFSLSLENIVNTKETHNASFINTN